jgi:hypothetical protein
MGRQDSASFLKKRSKRLLFAGDLACAGAWPQAVPDAPGAKVFCFFFSKKKRFLSPARYSA